MAVVQFANYRSSNTQYSTVLEFIRAEEQIVGDAQRILATPMPLQMLMPGSPTFIRAGLKEQLLQGRDLETPVLKIRDEFFLNKLMTYLGDKEQRLAESKLHLQKNTPEAKWLSDHYMHRYRACKKGTVDIYDPDPDDPKQSIRAEGLRLINEELGAFLAGYKNFFVRDNYKNIFETVTGWWAQKTPEVSGLAFASTVEEEVARFASYVAGTVAKDADQTFKALKYWRAADALTQRQAWLDEKYEEFFANQGEFHPLIDYAGIKPSAAKLLGPGS